MAYTDLDNSIIPYVNDDEHDELLRALGLVGPPPDAQPPAATAVPSNNSSPIAATTPAPTPVSPFAKTLKEDQDKLELLKAQGPAVTHKHGFAGNLLKGLDIAGTIFMPNAMAAIPGTRINFARNLNAAQSQVNEDLANQKTFAEIPETDAVKPIGTPIETTSGTFQAFADKNGNPIVRKLDIPAGKSQDYDIKEVEDNRDTIPDPRDSTKQVSNPNKGQTVYASVNKTNPQDIRYFDARVPQKDSAVDSPDKAMAALNKAHKALTDAVNSGNPERIKQATDAVKEAQQNYSNLIQVEADKARAGAIGRFPEQQANREAQIKASLTGKGAEDATKADQAYLDTKRQADNLRETIAAAKNKDALAAAIAPLEGTLFVTTANGIKRINETELRGFQMAGSTKDRIEGWLNGKISGDTIPSDIKDGFMALADQYQKNAYKNYKDKLNSLNSRMGTKLDAVGYDGTVGGTTEIPEADTIRVQIPGQPPGTIKASQKDAFFKKYPNAQIVK